MKFRGFWRVGFVYANAPLPINPGDNMKLCDRWWTIKIIFELPFDRWIGIVILSRTSDMEETLKICDEILSKDVLTEEERHHFTKLHEKMNRIKVVKTDKEKEQ